MEARLGAGEAHGFYSGSGVQQFLLRDKSELIKQGKRNFEWDLNDWTWDADLFIATPLNSVQTVDTNTLQGQQQIRSNNSSSCSDEINQQKRELEKRRRVVVFEEEDEGNLTLKLGGDGYPIPSDEKYGKKSKISGVSVSNRTSCQVENCEADLSIAKDYHRRHKVCEMHSKATKALVANVLQRFCQQCSRFHLLQEFDEGKRSCRRRLAGHNRRRRKTHPEATVNASNSNDDRSSNYLLISLLRILSNMHTNNSDQAKDQDIVSHLLKNLASYEGTIDGRNVSGIIRESNEVVSAEDPAFASSKQNLVSSGHKASRHLCSTSQINKVSDAHGSQLRAVNQNLKSGVEVPEKGNVINNYADGVAQTLPFRREDCSQAEVFTLGSTVGRTKLNNIDLNSAYSDSQDYEGPENAELLLNLGNGSSNFPSRMQRDSRQSSPPQTSMNSDSLSGQSPSSSSGDAQSRTDRIVFKLFGKDPNHFPVGFRSQILNWLSQSPTDIEGYIRPGCIVLTIYLRLAESTWQELQDDLRSNLRRLLDVSDDSFWRTGWVYTRVQHHIAFIYNGQIVLDTVLPLISHNHSQIASVTPIAVSVSERAQFLVKGYNLSRPNARLLCTLEGKYLIQQATNDLLNTCALEEQSDIQCLTFPCPVPDSSGRGFLEVEDDGLSSGFFPFIVAEKDICLEIRMLESAVEVSDFSDDSPGFADKMKLKNQALDFIHEMGWLLRRSRMRAKLGYGDFKSDIFSFTRFRRLMEFSVDHGWCAVVKKLLDLLFHGNVGSAEDFSAELALLEIGLLHRAVRKRSRQMVEFLIRYIPDKGSDVAGSEQKQTVRSGSDVFLFRPDAVGPAGLTPLHIAASTDGSESLLDALTDDPGLVGVAAWKTVRDNTGLTPEDYARIRGHYSYIHLIHKKINKRTAGHVIVDIPSVSSDSSSNLKQNEKVKSAKVTGFEMGKLEMRPIKMKQSCKVCDHQLAYGNTRRLLMYRPAVLSMLAIAAVCVCVSLLFKSSPEVLYVDSFQWELLEYGPK